MSDASNDRMLRIRRTLAKTPVGKAQFLLMLSDVSFGAPDGNGKGSFDKDSRSIVIDPDLSDAEAVQELGNQVMKAFVETSKDQSPEMKQLGGLFPIDDMMAAVSAKMVNEAMDGLSAQGEPGFDTLTKLPEGNLPPMIAPALGMLTQVMGQAMEQGFQMGMQDEGFRLEVESVLGDDFDNNNTPPAPGKDDEEDIPNFTL